MKILALILAAGALFAQTPFRPSGGPPAIAYQQILTYDGSSNLLYMCQAKSVQMTEATRSVAISAASNAAAAVLTSASHGFNANSLPIITVSGGTGNWTGVNGTRTATIIDANTFSVPVNSTGFGALTGSLVFTTQAPRTNRPVWAVWKGVYTGTNLIWAGWVGGTTAETQTCVSPTQYQ